MPRKGGGLGNRRRLALFIVIAAIAAIVLGQTAYTVWSLYDFRIVWSGDRMRSRTYRDAPVTITGLVASGPPERMAELKPPVRFAQGTGELPPVDSLDWRDAKGNRTAPPPVGTRIRARYRWEATP